MGKYDHLINEPINQGKSYRSYRKAAKKKAAGAKLARTVQLKKAKARRDKAKAASSERYIPWPEYLM